MGLFQTSILKNYIKGREDKIAAAYKKHIAYFHNPERQKNLREIKEEQFKEGFLRELFVNILGYTIFPELKHNLLPEQKNVQDAKKADGSILVNGEVVGVIELKGSKTVDLKQIEIQAFGYKNNHRKASYVITSNFEKLRFYIENTIDYEEFYLFNLTKEEFAILWICLAYENISIHLPKQLKNESASCEEQITKKLYTDYSTFKKELFDNLQKNNTSFNKLELFHKTQKLLDRFLFILFGEDKGLLPPNSLKLFIDQWDMWNEDPLNEHRQSLYHRFKLYFRLLDEGYEKKGIFAYNGELFKPDETLNALLIDDDILKENILKLIVYNFDTEVDVNILGHIFEHSLNEIEEVTNEITNGEKQISKRKKDGIFYTPRYITSYIVENTLGKLCADKKCELEIDESDYYFDLKRTKAAKLQLDKKLADYRNWLLTLTICDPACGSGAFLNATLDFLVSEHQYIDELTTKLFGNSIMFPDVESAILENNLYGVDINDESVEIAKLALWLRTAQPKRKLNTLNNNIKCGNSLISEPEVAREKAFDWHKEFPQVFENGGFDVIIGNPPYGVNFNEKEKQYFTKFDDLVPDFEIYIYFISLYSKILKPEGLLSYIFPNTFLSTLFGKKYRDNLFNNVSIYQIVDLSNDHTFEDASVRTCIFSFSNTNSEYNTKLYKLENKEFIFKNIYSKIDILKETENILSLFSQSNEEKSIIKKILKNSPLKSFFEVSQGLIPYDKYRGHDEYTIKNRIWHADCQKDETYRQELKGSDINRYILKWNGNLWISYGEWLAAPRDQKYFTKERVLVREITADRLLCTYTDKEFYNTPSIINIINEKHTLNLKYCLVVLNSALIGWLHNKISPKANKGLFPKILINDVRNMPLVEITLEQQQPFIDLADKMLFLNSDLQTNRQQFLNLLSNNFPNLKITGILESFDELEFKQLMAELAKQKISIPLKEQKEWEEQFNEYKQTCCNLAKQIADTDKEIDRMIYELYGLDQKEINIIEK